MIMGRFGVFKVEELVDEIVMIFWEEVFFVVGVLDVCVF